MPLLPMPLSAGILGVWLRTFFALPFYLVVIRSFVRRAVSSAQPSTATVAADWRRKAGGWCSVDDALVCFCSVIYVVVAASRTYRSSSVPLFIRLAGVDGCRLRASLFARHSVTRIVALSDDHLLWDRRVRRPTHLPAINVSSATADMVAQCRYINSVLSRLRLHLLATYYSHRCRLVSARRSYIPAQLQPGTMAGAWQGREHRHWLFLCQLQRPPALRTCSSLPVTT